LITLAQQACALAPIAIPSFIVGNQDETATLILALANRAGEELARRPQGGWVSMIREYDFTTQALAPQSGTIYNIGSGSVITGLSNTGQIQPFIWQVSGTGIANNATILAVTSSTVTLSLPATSTGSGTFTFGQSDYQLPSDFQRPIDNTFWDRSRFWSMRGPQSPQQWQLYKSSVIGRASIQRRYRFRSIRAGVGMQLGQYLSIDPLPLDNGSQLVFEYVSNGWCESVAGVPQNTWQTDSDVGVLDEYLLGLSLTYRLLRRLGLAYSEELDEYERQVDKALGSDGGAAILDIAPSNSLSLLGPWNLPETGYGGTPT
jgi:hypothetical protein